MQVYLKSVDGIADAITSLYMSKRTWTHELEEEVRETVADVTDRYGRLNPEAQEDQLHKFNHMMEKVVRYGKQHTTLLSFIDLSFTVEGMHRAGQDDADSHSKRFDNRIVRSSSRLAKFDRGEMSDWYKGKILTYDQVFNGLGVNMPDEIEYKDGSTFVRTVNGYVLKDLAEDKDVLRGLYPLCIPSNFIFRCNLAQFCHVYQMRKSGSGANPEVQLWAEQCADQIEEFQPMLNRELLTALRI